MKKSRLLLLPLLAATLPAFAATPPSAAVVRPVVYRGMASVCLSNPVMEVIVTPGINRIMSIRRLPDGENVLWNSWRHRHYPWVNYGGSKLLPAPQSAWKYPWPPARSLDQEPGQLEPAGPGTVILRTPYCQRYGVSFERRLTLHPTLPRLTLEETIINRSAVPLRWGIWEISQLPAGGTALLPGFDADQLDRVRHLDDFGYARCGRTLHIRDNQQKVKGFYHSPLGIMGYRRNGTTLWRFAPPPRPDEVYPEDETNLTFFSGLGTFELETVSPLWLLRPGERRTVTYDWFVVPDSCPLPGLSSERFPPQSRRFPAISN